MKERGRIFKVVFSPTKACLILTFEENYDSVFEEKNESK
jgi:hypothetical protein